MKTQTSQRRYARTRSMVLFAAILVIGGALATWKLAAAQRADAAAANQPEQVEVVTGAVAEAREHRGSTTSIGTVLATRSVMLRNELPGTVRQVQLTPGQVVDAGAVLVALDVSVEEAELKALQAQLQLAETTLQRVERMYERRAVSAIELDNARAERDVAEAQIDRTRAIIARKTIRAPFRARVGIADVHPGQFLDAGTPLTTLQGVDEVVHVDFSVSQGVAEGLSAGSVVEVLARDDASGASSARVVAVDARVDPSTRNAAVRARVEGDAAGLAPGSSVRVRVPVGEARLGVSVPVNALRRGPAGDHVFVLETAENDETRARVRTVLAGPVIGGEVMVLSGLEPGERVATSGSFKLREAALVYVAGDAVASAGSER